MSPTLRPMFTLLGVAAIPVSFAAASRILSWSPAPRATIEPTAPGTLGPVPKDLVVGTAAPKPVTTVAGDVTLTARLDRGAVLQGSDGELHVELILKGAEGALEQHVPTDLVVVVDRSGSMAGEKLQYARDAVAALADELQPEDRLAIVSYDDTVTVDAPLELATPQARQRWRRVARQLNDGGSTNISGGLDMASVLLAEHAPDRSRRVMLISDGQPNAGDASTPGLVGRARQSALVEAPLTAVGVGLDFNEDLMRSMAEAGTGNFYFLNTGKNLATLFHEELKNAGSAVASSLEIHLPSSSLQLQDAGGLPIAWEQGGASVAMGGLSAGQERHLWLTLQAPTTTTGPLTLPPLTVRWKEGGVARSAVLGDGFALNVTADPNVFAASIDQDAWALAVTKDEYGRLRTDVATYVKAGDKASADALLSSYRDRIGSLNRWVGSAEVNDNLRQLGTLQTEIDDAFQGQNQAEKQNTWSKRANRSSYVDRQLGALGYIE